ncbi:hypothetical protein ONZ45_g14974 [Pleurotus djamor]|nr:hypothetical protein ONZ45_g14974 [Pleurotus djamor]
MTTYTYFREGDVVQSSFDGSFHVIVKAGSPSEPPLTMPVSVAMSMGLGLGLGMMGMPMPGMGTPPFMGGGVGGGAMGPGPGEVWLGSPPRSIATATTTTASTNNTNNAANDTTATADGIEDQDVGFAYGAHTHGHGHGHDIDPSTGLPVFYDTAMHTPLPAPGVGAGVGGGSRPQSSATRSLSNRSSPNSLDSFDANSTTYSTTDNPYHHHLPSLTSMNMNMNMHPSTIHPPIGSAKSSKNNALDIPAIEAGMDTRTTVMIRNIPNKMTDRHLIGYIDSVRPRRIDFLYLRMDFKNGCNVGYAFVNFITVGDLVEFAKAKLGRKWNMFASEKVLEMSYADYQGKEAQVEKFKNSSIMDEREDWRPKIFYSEPGPEQGLPEPFPSPTHLRRKQLSQSNRVGLFPRKP